MSATVYCDVGEVPKGKRRGSMNECAEKGQIKYYGEKKVDKKIIDSIIDKKGTKKNPQKELDDIKVKLASMIGKIKTLTRKIDDEDDAKAAKKLEKEKKDMEKEFEKMKDKAISLKKKIDAKKGGSRRRSRTSRKSSRRSSRQKGGSTDKKDHTWICD